MAQPLKHPQSESVDGQTDGRTSAFHNTALQAGRADYNELMILSASTRFVERREGPGTAEQTADVFFSVNVYINFFIYVTRRLRFFNVFLFRHKRFMVTVCSSNSDVRSIPLPVVAAQAFLSVMGKCKSQPDLNRG